MARAGRQDGFTLIELLVVVAILAMVAAALLGVYQISQQTYTRASSLEDAQLGARAGLDRMASEFRLIGSYWSGAVDAGNAITAASSTSITFRGDIDTDSVSSGTETTVTTAVANTNTLVISGTASAFNTYSTSSLNDYVHIADGIIREVKQVSAVASSTITLATALRYTYSTAATVRSVETVTYSYDSGAGTLTRTLGGGTAEPIVDNATGLTLTYYDANGNSLGSSPSLSSIYEIGISITTKGSDGSRRTMTSRVRPRSLSFQ